MRRKIALKNGIQCNEAAPRTASQSGSFFVHDVTSGQNVRSQSLSVRNVRPPHDRKKFLQYVCESCAATGSFLSIQASPKT